MNICDAYDNKIRRGDPVTLMSVMMFSGQRNRLTEEEQRHTHTWERAAGTNTHTKHTMTRHTLMFDRSDTRVFQRGITFEIKLSDEEHTEMKTDEEDEEPQVNRLSHTQCSVCVTI